MAPSRTEQVVAKALVSAAFVLSVMTIAPVLGPVMHESDQAAILHGSVRLAQGVVSPWAADCYNYDKQYLTYWIMAGTHRLLPAVDVVALGNVLGFFLFWSGSLAALMAGGIRRFGQAAGICACLLAPTLWLHSGFLASAFLSAGFLLFAWALCYRSAAGTGRRSAALLLLFLAVGCRADAILVLPWFAWTVSTPLLRLQRNWLAGLAATGITAFLLGRLIYTGIPIDLHQPFILPRLYAAYAVFGLGAGTGVLVWLGFTLLGIARKRWPKRPRAALFYALGLPALLLPWAYYSLQLFSTRYWTLQLCAACAVLLTRRGRVLLAWPRHPTLGRIIPGLLLVLAVLQVFVGIHLPFPDRPRLVLSGPTVFPTADGLQPMGATWSFLRTQASSPQSIVDHNQATWLAARQTRFQTDATGRVPVLDFSLRSYVLLATALQGADAYVVSPDAPWYYADRRDLLRVYHTADAFAPADHKNLVAHVTVHHIGPEVAGYEILRVEQGPLMDEDFKQHLFISQALRGNEYQIMPAYRHQREIVLPESDAGKTVALFSDRPFTAGLARKDGSIHPLSVRLAAGSSYHLAVIPGVDRFGATVVIAAGDPSLAITVHPDYMGVDRL